MDHPRDRETLVRSLAIFVERDGWHDIAHNEERCDVAELCLGGWRSHWTSTLRVATVLNKPASIEAFGPVQKRLRDLVMLRVKVRCPCQFLFCKVIDGRSRVPEKNGRVGGDDEL